MDLKGNLNIVTQEYWSIIHTILIERGGTAISPCRGDVKAYDSSSDAASHCQYKASRAIYFMRSYISMAFKGVRCPMCHIVWMLNVSKGRVCSEQRNSPASVF